MGWTAKRALCTYHCRFSSFSFSSSSSWTQAIRSANDLGRSRRALSLYVDMLRSGCRPDPFAIAVALKACARISAKFVAVTIHGQLHKLGFHSHIYPQTSLADLYSKIDGMEAARKVFNGMPVKNVVSWNSILSMYLRAGELEAARRLFDEMPVRDIVSWNSIISGYAKAGDMDSAAELFDCMPERNFASWNGMISGYINRGDIGMARELFDEMPIRNNVSLIAMISGYTKCGDVVSARKIFDQMEKKDLYAWNAMIACYAQNGCPREAIQSFNRMRKLDSGVEPDEMTFSSVISACSHLGNLRFGLWIEEYIRLMGIELDDHLSTALIDLYSKCGGIDRALELFGELRKRDLVSYSAMILGCGINGRANESVRLFQEMLDEKISPNAVTFVGLLTTYNHAGLIEEGRKCFASMSKKHKIAPTADHYAIIVDLLGRSGRLEEAYQLIRKMPMQPHVGVWGALLLASRLHGNIELGEIAARNCFKLAPKEIGYYVLLASLYAEAGKWDKAKKLRKIIEGERLNKTQGCSWVELI
ncbi:pentatricopeptide repeat-containing protein [Canna indica]|uniref:Pentatricopeptide repeat-containing protein n=1 Tax=Canna indica TaxID=4628 RepID=A0AAQ3JUR2_9LILI|nr:pentatricopeptide repeat-containing protein [Canna indica]